MSDGEREPASRIAISSHRLPTVSASQALQQSAPTIEPPIPLGLRGLDKLIVGDRGSSQSDGGIRRGQVIEVYGPPGIGKTALCMSAASAVLKRGASVVWIDARSPLPAPRLRAVLIDNDPATDNDVSTEAAEKHLNDRLDSFTHYSIPTLAHLLALLMHSPPTFAPAGTELLIVDSLATLVDAAHPRMNDRSGPRKNDGKSHSDRRRNAIVDIATSLTRLAAMKNIAVIVTNHMVTQIRSQPLSALLKPAFGTMEWENAMSGRVVLFRDWAQCHNEDETGSKKRPQAARFARTLKAGGVKLNMNRPDTLCAFDITGEGLHELTDTTIAQVAMDADSGAPLVPSKRSIDDVEVADSDDEYGWTEDDITLAAEGLVDERFLTAREVKAAAQKAEDATALAEDNAEKADG